MNALQFLSFFFFQIWTETQPIWISSVQRKHHFVRPPDVGGNLLKAVPGANSQIQSLSAVGTVSTDSATRMRYFYTCSKINKAKRLANHNQANIVTRTTTSLPHTAPPILSIEMESLVPYLCTARNGFRPRQTSKEKIMFPTFILEGPDSRNTLVGLLYGVPNTTQANSEKRAKPCSKEVCHITGSTQSC